MEDLMQRLPHDVLADVLRRLQPTSPCSLAASRCVCKAWCAVVDTHRLIADLLPHSLTGIFVHLDGETLPRHFPLGVSSTNIVPFDYLNTLDDKPLDGKYLKIKQHCNGLLLLTDVEWEEEWSVLNPATRQWAHLPPSPPMCTPGMEDSYIAQDCATFYHENYLVFDPSVSSHYQVFLVKCIPSAPDMSRFVECHIKRTEWPPSTYVLLVFSSRTKQWEERPFVREGEAAGTIGDLLEHSPPNHCFATYWAGALYFHQHDFILRITLKNDKYQVIEPPEGVRWGDYPDHNLGKSENGVYCARLYGHDGLQIRIWHLDEMGNQISWMLKCDINLHPLLADHDDCPSEQSYHTLLGFHPNKETVFFFHRTSKRVMAYHFNSSKIKDHGCLSADCICVSFPYTMCLMGGISSNKH